MEHIVDAGSGTVESTHKVIPLQHTLVNLADPESPPKPSPTSTTTSNSALSVITVLEGKQYGLDHAYRCGFPTSVLSTARAVRAELLQKSSPRARILRCRGAAATGVYYQVLGHLLPIKESALWEVKADSSSDTDTDKNEDKGSEESIKSKSSENENESAGDNSITSCFGKSQLQSLRKYLSQCRSRLLLKPQGGDIVRALLLTATRPQGECTAEQRTKRQRSCHVKDT